MTGSAVIRLGVFALDTGLSALFGLFLLLLAARGADLAVFGTFAMALAIAGIQTPLAVLGIASLFYVRAASRPVVANRLYRAGVFSALVSGVVLYATTLAVLWIFASPQLWLFYALAGLRVGGAFGEPLRAIYQARSSPGDYVPLRVVTLAAGFTACGVAFAQGGGIAWYAGIWGLEWLIFATALLVLSLRRGTCPTISRPRVRPILWKASPLFVQSICVAIYLRFDQLYVGWRFGEADLGLYAAAARIAEAGNMAYGLIALVVVPRIIREWPTGRLSVPSRAVLSVIGISSVVAAVLCVPWGGALLGVAFGPAFGAGGIILAVYVLSTCFTVYGTIGSRLNIAQGKTIPSMMSGLLGAISNVVLTVVLCEVQGPLGAATATVMSYGLSCALIWWSLYHHRASSLAT